MPGNRDGGQAQHQIPWSMYVNPRFFSGMLLTSMTLGWHVGFGCGIPRDRGSGLIWVLDPSHFIILVLFPPALRMFGTAHTQPTSESSTWNQVNQVPHFAAQVGIEECPDVTGGSAAMPISSQGTQTPSCRSDWLLFLWPIIWICPKTWAKKAGFIYFHREMRRLQIIYIWDFGVFACFRLNFEVSPLKFYGKPGKPNGCLQVGSA